MLPSRRQMPWLRCPAGVPLRLTCLVSHKVLSTTPIAVLNIICSLLSMSAEKPQFPALDVDACELGGMKNALS